VGVQTMKVTGVLTNRNATINKPMHEEDKTSKVNPQHATSIIKGRHAMKTPNRHPNHKRKYLNQPEYQYHS
jgi:hypothetical protein